MNLRPIPWWWLAKLGAAVAAIWLFQDEHPALRGALLVLASIGVAVAVLSLLEYLPRVYRHEQLKLRNREALRRDRERRR